MSMKTGGRLLRGVAAVVLVGASLLTSQANAQQGAACSVVAHRNVTMFERMVAEKLSAGWEVKGGIAFFDVGGWTVLMCSR